MPVCLKHTEKCGFLLFFLLHAIPCLAQQPDSLRVKELESVRISANKSRFQLTATVPVQTLSGAALQRLNSFSVADAVRFFSGVQLKDYGGIGGLKTINVRSMGTQHVGVFLDGASVGNAQNGTVDLGKFSLDNIDAITLYNAHNPELLQPAKAIFASSALYLQSSRPQFSDAENTKLRAAFKTGAFGLVNPSLLWQQKLSAATSLTVNTEFITAHGRYRFYKKEGAFDTTAIRQNADITAWRTEAGLFKKLQSSGEAFIKAYYYQSNRGLPGAVVENRFYNPQRLWDRNAFVHGSYKNKLNNKYSLLLNLKYTNDYTKYKDPSYVTDKGPLENNYTQQEWYASMAQKYIVTKQWELGLSTDFALNTLDANLYRFAYPKRYSYLAALSNNFTWQRFIVQANLLYGHFNERVKYYEASADRSITSPTISASWKPFANKGFSLRSFYKESLRMPTFNDLYYTLIGNISLKPEYTRQYDWGFTWMTDAGDWVSDLSVQADIYYNRVKDKIIAMPAANLFRWMMLNMGRVDIKGLEVSMSFTKYLPAELVWNAGFNYTYQQALNKTQNESSYNQQIPNIPVHSGTAHGSLLWKNWALNYSYIYTGERYVLPENTARNYAPAWYTTDLGIVYEKRSIAKRWKIGVEVNNMFNQYYDVVLNFPMPGRNYRFTFIINIQS